MSCPICLHVWNDPTVLDNCQHIFCFECITEWTRLKPECPLCKCGLLSLKHRLLFPEGETPTWKSEGKEESIVSLRSEYEFEQILTRTSYPADVEQHQVELVVKHLIVEIGALRTISMRGALASQSIYRTAICGVENELKEYKMLLNKFNNGATRAQLFNEHAFRRVVYLNNLTPRAICPSIFNVVFNAEYVAGNRKIVRAQIMHFVIREVMALTRNTCVDIDIYLDTLLDYLSSKINRTEIVIFLKQRGIQNPHHFLNNLTHFASTGQTLEVYDQNSEYSSRRSGILMGDDDDVLVLNDGGAGGDVEVVGERRRRLARPSVHERGERVEHGHGREQHNTQDRQSSMLERLYTYFYTPIFPVSRDEQQRNQLDLPSWVNSPRMGGEAEANGPSVQSASNAAQLRQSSSSHVGTFAHPPGPSSNAQATASSMVTLEDDSDDDEAGDAVEFLQEIKRPKSLHNLEEEESEDDEEMDIENGHGNDSDDEDDDNNDEIVDTVDARDV
ncbi:hypothetical protein niasHS_002187 [Heterodera schachtii]|uniref:RING-type E3 ubiquitin transferase n=1 Tax=Heterodera schachtii TaxID=97005 RepID=A0ABD2KMI3_HETSC